MQKKCPDCEQAKELEEFGANKNSPDGLSFYCKECSAIRRKSSHVIRSLRQWTERHDKQCARCGRIDDLQHLWLLGEMIPVTICPSCRELYGLQEMTIEQFYSWIRMKQCARCGYTWNARHPKVALCSRCKSPNWQGEE